VRLSSLSNLCCSSCSIKVGPGHPDVAELLSELGTLSEARAAVHTTGSTWSYDCLEDALSLPRVTPTAAHRLTRVASSLTSSGRAGRALVEAQAKKRKTKAMGQVCITYLLI